MEFLKSRKIKLICGVLAVIVAVYFLGFKSRGPKVAPIEEEKIPAFMKTGGEVPYNPPVYTRIKELRDPFKDMEMRAWKLENLILLKKKEVELLKAALEESKLRKAIGELGGNMETPALSRSSLSGKSPSNDKPRLLAISIGENSRKALLEISGERIWMSEGEVRKGLCVEGITDQWVSISFRGKKLKLKRGEK